MPKNNEIRVRANNSTSNSTSTHETGNQFTPEQQSAYEVGLKQGRLEGALSYQKHILNQLTKEREKMVQSLQKQKGGSK